MEKTMDTYRKGIGRHKGLCVAVCIILTVILSNYSLAGDIRTFKVSLSKLAPLSTVELKGARSSYIVKLPVPERWEVQRALMHFSYVNSASLLPKRSRLTVRLNSHVLAQIPLQPQSPVGRVDLNLPPGMLKNTYNNLEFFAFQNYIDQCSDPNAPELWTNIELDTSYIEIDYTLKPVPLRVSSISHFLFDPKLFDMNIVNIVIQDTSPDNLHLASIAASGVSMRFQYRPVRFLISRQPMDSTDNIVIGTTKFISDVFTGSGIAAPDSQFGIESMPGDDSHGMIFISGASYEDILKNTRAFSVISYPLPDTPTAAVEDVILPAIAQYEGKKIVSPKMRYSFGDLGLSTVTFQGINPVSADLSFRIPSDALIKENEYVVLSVHLVYGATMRSDSVLNLHLNGTFAGAIPLNDQKGGRYQGYLVRIPGSLLESGQNTLSFAPALTPSSTGKCAYLQTDNLIVSLYENSTIEMPSMQHWIEMPSIRPFMQDGFPFTKWPDWRETVVLLTDKSTETASAAINIVSMISQKNGVQPFGIRFSYELPEETDRDILIVGTYDRIPEDILDSSPVSPSVMYPWTGHLQTAPTWQDRIKKKVSRDVSHAQVSVKTALEGNKLLISEFESPLKIGRSILLMSAKRQQDLLNGSYALWEPSLQSQFVHDLTLVDLTSPEPTIYSQEAGKKYYVGEIGQINILDYYLHSYFWIAVAALVIGILLLAWIIYLLIKGYRARRLRSE